jgi:hypothetical protein
MSRKNFKDVAKLRTVVRFPHGTRVGVDVVVPARPGPARPGRTLVSL